MSGLFYFSETQNWQRSYYEASLAVELFPIHIGISFNFYRNEIRSLNQGTI